jgi:RNA polymerase sigma factor (sigma-70 family)
MSEPLEDEIKRLDWRTDHITRKARVHELNTPWIEDLPDGTGVSPEEAAEANELRQALLAAISNIPPLNKAVLLETYFGGRSDAEIALEHGIPLARVRVTRYRALQALRKDVALMGRLQNFIVLRGESL